MYDTKRLGGMYRAGGKFDFTPILSPVVEKEQTYARRDGRIYLVRQNSQAARTGKEKYILFYLFN